MSRKIYSPKVHFFKILTILYKKKNYLYILSKMFFYSTRYKMLTTQCLQVFKVRFDLWSFASGVTALLLKILRINQINLKKIEILICQWQKLTKSKTQKYKEIQLGYMFCSGMSSFKHCRVLWNIAIISHK